MLVLREKAKQLRSLGKTYGEIQRELNKKVPKSTLTYWCKDVELPDGYFSKIKRLNKLNLEVGRSLAWLKNRKYRERYLESIRKANKPLVKLLNNRNIAKLVLAALYLGEGKKKGGFSLGNSNPEIIKLFLGLLDKVFGLDISKIRCTVQCRADQNINKLEGYWSNISGVPRKQFYKARVDPRTVGKPTKNTDYKGVLRIDYFDTKACLELKYLASLTTEYIIGKSRADSSAG